MPNIQVISSQLKQESCFKNKFTLCIDIEHTFLTELNPQNMDDLSLIKYKIEDKEELLVVKKYVKKSKSKLKAIICTNNHCSRNQCYCKHKYFLVRPYTYELLSAIQPFFEIIGISKMHYEEINQVITLIEKHLNKPINKQNKQMKVKLNEEKQSKERGGQSDESYKQFDRIGRFKPKYLEKVLYFHYLICEKTYVHFRDLDEYLENLTVLLQNRHQSKIFIISSNKMRLMAAMSQGFCGIPLTKFSKYIEDDF